MNFLTLIYVLTIGTRFSSGETTTEDYPNYSEPTPEEEEKMLADNFFNRNVHMWGWLKCDKIENYKEFKNLSKKWYDERDKGVWYYVMGNKWQIISMGWDVGVHDPKSIEARDACFTHRQIKAGIEITGYGGKKVVLHRGKMDPTIVWTDNKKYVLAVWCHPTASRDAVWALRSTENAPPDQITKDKVLAITTEMGFRVKDAVTHSKQGCPNIS